MFQWEGTYINLLVPSAWPSQGWPSEIMLLWALSKLLSKTQKSSFDIVPYWSGTASDPNKGLAPGLSHKQGSVCYLAKD